MIKIILNPVAGRYAGRAARPVIEEFLQSQAVDYEITETEGIGHAIQIAEQAARSGIPVVAAVGGDGTANEVINGLMQAKVAGFAESKLAVLPVGSGNDFSYAVNIPPDLPDSLPLLINQRSTRIDIGKVTGGFYPQGRYFGNGVGIGFDAVVGFQAAKIKWLRGFSAYILATLQTVFLYYKAPSVHLEYSGFAVDKKLLMISIMNGKRLGGGFYVTPDADQSDGLLDLCIAPGVTRTRIFGLIPHYLKGTQASQPEISTAQTVKISIQAASGTLPAHADGETICFEGDRLEIEVIPNALEVIC